MIGNENMASKVNGEDPSQMENDIEIKDVINYLTKVPNVKFKNQQIGEEELSNNEKINIANSVYEKSTFLFLTKFGQYLTSDHLKYFENKFKDDDDIKYLINTIVNILATKNNKNIIKNRRYEALLKMLDEGTYFSEVEMMKRNPLLYEQLIGKYLTQDEKIKRDNIDTQNITLLNVLMEGVDKQITKDKFDKQKHVEECQMEESDDDNDLDVKSEDEGTHKLWGEFSGSASKRQSKSKKEINNGDELLITGPERSLLREEFVNEMFRSFLAGEDKDFDYNEIDENAEYDSIEIRNRDEEEKYFDSETPEDVMDEDNNETRGHDDKKEDSEDELDIFMKHLNNHPSLTHNNMSVD